jgi:hypothetical protein
MFDIPHCPEITILGFSFTSNVARSGNVTWSKVTGKVNALASEVYGTDLCLTQRSQYVNIFLISKIWYTAQIFPATPNSNRLVHKPGCDLQGAAINSTRYDGERGLNLIDIAAKCRALFLTRFWAQGKGAGSLAAVWLNMWASLSTRANPPPHTHTLAISETMSYLRSYILEWACVEPQMQAETHTSFTRRVYDTLRTISTAGTNHETYASCSFNHQ